MAANRHDPGGPKFVEAVNEVPVLFSEDQGVIEAFIEFADCAGKAESRTLNNYYTTLLRSAAKSAGIPANRLAEWVHTKAISRRIVA